MAALAPFAPMGLGVAGAVVSMLLQAWGRRGSAVTAAVLGLVAGAIAVPLLSRATQAGAVVGTGSTISLPVAACLVLGAVVIAACSRTLSSSGTGARTAALTALATVAAATVAGATDVAVLFLAVETLALCGYGLVALGGTDRARESAMKWFVQGSVASAVFILGIAVLVSRTGGATSYDAIATAAAAPAASGALAVGYVLVIAALAFKAGAFPFHGWMPDAFETAPAAGVAVLASAGKVGPLAAMVWLTSAVAGATGTRVVVLVAAISAASIVFGNIAALRQRSLARMLAYSGIAQVGYALAGVPLGASAGTVLLFAVFYGLTSAASFVFIVALQEAEPAWDGSVAGLAGLSRRRPAMALSLAVIMLSLTGIPMTAGFWGKFFVFAAAAVGGYVWLAIVGMLGSVVSFGYYGAVMRSAFMDAETGESEPVAKRAAVASLSTASLAVLILLVGVVPFIAGLGVLVAPFR
jgi:NADH-quinone oxidoreductase subunit N